MKQEQLKKGVDVISLGIGDPDLPTPPHIIEALARAAADPANHQYPSYEGMLALRRAAADWYRSRFGVTLDPATEVLSLIGSKEGIGHFPLAFVNPGDVVLAPDPAYPVYQAGTLFAGGETYPLPLRRERGFLPDLDAIPGDILKRAKILWLNYPNNPTGAVAPREFLGPRRRGHGLAHRYGVEPQRRRRLAPRCRTPVALPEAPTVLPAQEHLEEHRGGEGDQKEAEAEAVEPSHGRHAPPRAAAASRSASVVTASSCSASCC
jgi:hypothetical protein